MFDRLEHFFRNQDNMITLVAVLSASTVTTTFLQFFSGAYVFLKINLNVFLFFCEHLIKHIIILHLYTLRYQVSMSQIHTE